MQSGIIDVWSMKSRRKKAVDTEKAGRHPTRSSKIAP